MINVASPKINTKRRFECAKQDYLDLVRVPELRGKVPGINGSTAGNLNGTSYRLYNWKPSPEPGEKPVEFTTYKAKPWSLWVRFWKPDGQGGWIPTAAPSAFDDDSYLDEEEEKEVWVTATNVTEGNLSRWLLLAPEALDKNAIALPGWAKPRHFSSLAAMEEALFEIIDELLEPSTEEGPRAYIEAQIAEADDVSSLKGRILAYFQKTLTKAEAKTNAVVNMLLENAKVAFEMAFPDELSQAIDPISLYFPDEEEFLAAFESGASSYQSALFGERGEFVVKGKRNREKFMKDMAEAGYQNYAEALAKEKLAKKEARERRRLEKAQAEKAKAILEARAKEKEAMESIDLFENTDEAKVKSSFQTGRLPAPLMAASLLPMLLPAAKLLSE